MGLTHWAAQQHKSLTPLKTTAPGKDQILKFKVWFILNFAFT
jgi:hypothetical protein